MFSKCRHSGLLLRTPLHGILGCAATLQRSLTTNSTIGVEEREHVDTIAACANGNLRIVNDILDLAKLQHSKLTLQIAEFDVRTCIESAMAKAMAIPKAAELKLSLSMPCDISMYGDNNRLRQILLNLLSNSVRFTPEKGSVTLSCTCQVATADMTEEDSIEIRFAVRDTGTGISADESRQLLKEFFFFSFLFPSDTGEFGHRGRQCT